MSYATTRLASTLALAEFVRKGNAFFRLHGDGVLQILKFERENGGSLELNLGLHSLYSELNVSEFSASGCILQYSSMNVIGKRWFEPNPWKSPEDNVDYQVEVLCERILPWLDGITTQCELSECLCFLETSWGGKIKWVDSTKIAPYLSCGDYVSAKKVVMSIISQHNDACRSNKSIMTPQKYQMYIDRVRKEDESLERVMAMLEKRDDHAIRCYLQNNYCQNLSLFNKKIKRS